jgi:hypothetical protein
MVHVDGYKHSSFATYTAQLQTYVNWPHDMKHTPESLSAAGFFYTGRIYIYLLNGTNSDVFTRHL